MAVSSLLLIACVGLHITLSQPGGRTLKATASPEQSNKTWELLSLNNKRIRTTIEERIIIVEGPAGPPGPPGANITMKDMLQAFKRMVKKAAEKRARRIIRARCPSCLPSSFLLNDTSVFYPGVEDRVRTVNRSPTVFSLQLRSQIDIMPDNTIQLGNLQLEGVSHARPRGVDGDFGLNGELRVKLTGIYQFTATLTFHTGHRMQNDSGGEKKNYVRAMICPNGECLSQDRAERFIGTQYIHSLDTRQRWFTIQFTAMLEIKKSEFASVHIENASGRLLTVQSGSQVVGIMMSV